MSNLVLVLDTNRKPLNPCRPGVARSLLRLGKAKVFRRFPFTIVLNKAVDDNPQPIQLKLDPGSKTTGIALLQGNQVVWGAELTHRGQQIKDALELRRALRRGRRNRKTRYRQPRFLNRTRPDGWLAPSLQHRIETIFTWVNRLRRYAPITGISQEVVRFDLQQIDNPEIAQIEYQQGTLFGCEIREYLLAKWEQKCAYCSIQNVPLQIEHIQPKAKGGTNRISNLCLACEPCNIKKGTQNIEVFLKNKPDVLKRVLAQVKRPSKDAAAINSTRWALLKRLKQTDLPIETGSGGQTKYNRCRLELAKTHWIDAACVGKVEQLEILAKQPLLIKSTGHGTRQMCGTDKYGFPTRHRSRTQIHKGFQTGDIVKAVVSCGKKIGIYIGRVLCRATGSFDIVTKDGRISGISYRYCFKVHQKDGYSYAF
ncbi:RNA-guided endonuclease IscB [Microseira sp. BLCC-F43]|jgi:5-methylcytosine-specific restriction endonuclease McrA|uniref:RNA-guided endonuclease IscB n=1 Tax=Microseira sp. BLCC-F43 TaxID=3153602 RepID=UPI0035B6C889